jgi:hypothetical protein
MIRETMIFDQLEYNEAEKNTKKKPGADSVAL